MMDRLLSHCTSRRLHSLWAVLLLALIAGGCAHSLAVTSDPPGQTVYFDDEAVGVTPLMVEEHKPYAMHRIRVGEGDEAATRIVPANRLFARTPLTAAIMPASSFLLLPGLLPAGTVSGLQVLLPTTAFFLVPAMFTAGTVDRVHVIHSLSGEPLGPLDDAAVDLEYLPLARKYPAGVQVESRMVDGRRVRVMVERRRFVFSLNYLGFHFEDRLFGPGRRLSAGAEFEWLPTPRWSMGVGAARLSSRYEPAPGEWYEGVTEVAFREDRLGLFGRYRLPLWRWDGVTGGLDVPLTLGGELLNRRLGSGATAERDLLLQPYAEAGLDAQLTSAVVLFSALRYFPPLYTGDYVPPVDAGRLTFGVRFLF